MSDAPAAAEGGGGGGDLTVGIVGGMGPLATVSFLQLLLDKTAELVNIKIEEDHVKFVCVNNPTIPNRNNAICDGKDIEACGAAMEAVCEQFSPTVDFVICVCNTAHHFQAQMQRGLAGNNIPFLSIIRLVTARVVQMSTPTSKVAVLGGNGCMRSGLYQKSLADAGVTPFTLDAERQSLVMKAIYHVKVSELAAAQAIFTDILLHLVTQNVDIVVLGCTEFPIMIKGLETPATLSFIDSTDVLAEMTVKVCKRIVALKDAL